MKRRARQWTAMTAVEVLAATVLASLMLAAVAGLLGALARRERVLRASDHVPGWHEQLADELQWDLMNSRSYSASRVGIRLVGFAGRDFITGQPTGRPAAVEYFLTQAGPERWLFRKETHLDELTNDTSRSEIVCRDVDHLQFGSVIIDQIVASPDVFRMPDGETESPVPERIQIQLFSHGGAGRFFDRLFITR